MQNFIAFHPENVRTVVCEGNPMDEAQVLVYYADESRDNGVFVPTTGDCILFDDEFYSVFDFERERL